MCFGLVDAKQSQHPVCLLVQRARRQPGRLLRRQRRDVAPTVPNRLWVAELSELSTGEGKLYLAVVLDCYSRRSGRLGDGRAPARRARPRALEMTIAVRRPDQ